MQLIFGIILGLLILVILVVVHELGHAIIARRNGVVVEEFGIGFPPRAWAKKLKNGVLFSLNWLPLGGFVKLQGENDSANKKGDYGAASYWAKTRMWRSSSRWLLPWRHPPICQSSCCHFSGSGSIRLARSWDWRLAWSPHSRSLSSARASGGITARYLI